jgi:hypothetical protein
MGILVEMKIASAQAEVTMEMAAVGVQLFQNMAASFVCFIISRH